MDRDKEEEDKKEKEIRAVEATVIGIASDEEAVQLLHDRVPARLIVDLLVRESVVDSSKPISITHRALSDLVEKLRRRARA